jgi:hypothetical protein
MTLTRLALVATCLATAACAGGDSSGQASPTGNAGNSALTVRTDNNADVAGVQQMQMDGGLHVVTGPAAILYNPADSASGQYTVSATFRQNKAPSHAEAYGVIAGGQNLDNAAQSYLYFIVRGDGKWSLKHRASDTLVHTITEWTENAAVARQDSAGQVTNAVAVRFGSDSVHFLVNDTQVHAVLRSIIEGTDGHSGTTGIAGVRINHNLDVQVTGFSVSRGG